MTPSAVDAYYTGLEEGVVRVQVCGNCGWESLTPRGFCPECGADDWAVREESAPAGHLRTYSEIRVTGLPDLEPPVTVGMVELGGGARILARIDGEDPQVGDRVAFAGTERGKGTPAPVFAPVDDD